jgi:hypothetical protein
MITVSRLLPIGTHRRQVLPGRDAAPAYYSITWVDDNTVHLSGPWFRVTLKRR